MSERFLRCQQYHIETCGTSQVCFQCGQIGHVKRFCPMMSGIDSVGQSLAQPKALVQGFGKSTVRPIVSSRSEGRTPDWVARLARGRSALGWSTRRRSIRRWSTERRLVWGWSVGKRLARGWSTGRRSTMRE